MIFEETIAVLFQYLRQFTNSQIQQGQRIPNTRQMKKTVPSMSYSSCLVAKNILEEAREGRHATVPHPQEQWSGWQCVSQGNQDKSKEGEATDCECQRGGTRIVCLVTPFL